MKKHNILKVVLLAILVVFVCTWIFPLTYYNYELVEQAGDPVGLFELFSYPLVAFNYFSHTFVYVLVVGMFYGVMHKIPAYKKLLEKIRKGFLGKEWIFLVISIVVLAAITSCVGFSFGLILLFPMLISLITMMGYNKLVAASVTVGSIVCGMIGTTFAQDNFSYIDMVLGTTYSSELMFKGILLGVSVVLLIIHVLSYGKKTKNQNSEEIKEFVPEAVAPGKSKKVRVWPLVIVFDLLLVVLLLGAFPWATVFPKFEAFTNALTWIKEFELSGFPILSALLGDVQVFGEWSYMVASIPVATFPVVILFATGIMGLVYRIKFNDFLDALGKGAKKAIKPAMIMILIYMILIIATYHPFQLAITKVLLEATEGLNVLTMSAIAFLASFFNVEGMYQIQSTLPYVVSVFTNEEIYPIIGMIFQSIYGVAMLVLPSSVILMGTLDYLGVSYGSWLKHIWKLFAVILIVLLAVFLIMVAV